MALSISILWRKIPWQSSHSLNHLIQFFVTFFLHPCEFLEGRNGTALIPTPSTRDSEETKPVNPKGNRPWIFTGYTHVEAEAPILWPPHLEEPTLWKRPWSGKDWGQEKGETEDEMVVWYYRLDGHEFEQTPGDSEGQTGKPGMVFMRSKRVSHNLATEQQQQTIRHVGASIFRLINRGLVARPLGWLIHSYLDLAS